ncbi:hypothetical protein [Azospirillum sp.]|uniref:hypothetical protein n=1 Tax=Azospirillum sp. TaxID=34012 RepID=UPI002D3972E2|nr:hypothetical protein [Azospirillum sp.]HYF89786.1 hypothetical protein [Azospirillum sp.]
MDPLRNAPEKTVMWLSQSQAKAIDGYNVAQLIRKASVAFCGRFLWDVAGQAEAEWKKHQDEWASFISTLGAPDNVVRAVREIE